MNNLDHFCKRFPKYALLATRWETKELKPAIHPQLDLTEVEILYLYNAAYVYEKLKSWLHEKSDRRLVFIESDPGQIAALFHEETTLFQDEQVDIEIMPTDLQELADKYPAEKIEVIGNSTIRLELLRKTALSYSLFIDRLHGFQTFENFVRNVPQLKGAFYANGLKNALKGTTAIICGAGPSLEKVSHLLKDLQKNAIIIAGGSSVAALCKQNITPHFGMALDPNFEEYKRFNTKEPIDCPLLFSTRLHPDVFKRCVGPLGYLRSGIGGVPELWLEEEMGLTDPLLGKNLSDESMSVTPICIAFAEHLGCSRIILVGVDLAYTDGKRYAKEVLHEKEEIQSKSASDLIMRKKDKQGKFVETAVRWVMEAAAISHFAKKHAEIDWINATVGGLQIDGIENRLLKDVQFIKKRDFRGEIAKLIEKHPMPEMERDFLEELRSSLKRMIEHLEVLVNKKNGSKALAEFEMKEELVASILFYDMEKVIRQTRREDKWVIYLEIAEKYFRHLQMHTLATCSEVSVR
jgi:hypothetical protein